MLRKEITFDSFIRTTTLLLLLVAVGFLVNRLSSVLLPFFIAWLLAYMLYPLVRFLQYRCRLRNRVVSIFAALLLVLGVITGCLFLIIPPVIEEVMKLSQYIGPMASKYLGESGIADNVQQFLYQFANESTLVQLVQQRDVMVALQTCLAQAWDFVYQTLGFLLGIFTVFVVFLYMFFILLDYETLSEGWIRLIPAERRPFIQGLAEDVERGM
ncbi:MAG: AI-2E family transporter, partial [Bacteroidaceae bacterium]|nr:AI-2E family transporter [Bacteroidaceae bacterium]